MKGALVTTKQGEVPLDERAVRVHLRQGARMKAATTLDVAPTHVQGRGPTRSRVTTHFVATRTADARLNDDQFKRRLQSVKRLQDETYNATRTVVVKLIELSVEYTALWHAVRGDSERSNELNEALGLDHLQAARFHTIAGVAEELMEIAAALPPYRESVYEVARQLKRDKKRVENDAKDGRLHPTATLQDVRDLDSTTVVKQRPDRRGVTAKATRPTTLNAFFRTVKRVTPQGIVEGEGLVDFALEVDAQAYGTTIVGQFVISNVALAKDGQLPSGMPTHIAAAVRQLWTKHSLPEASE